MENDIASMISKIVQNPEFVGMVNELRGDGKSPEATQKEMLEKLPEVVGMVAPMLGEEDGAQPHEKSPSKTGQKQKKYDKVRATKLMQAIKPYLSGGRAEIIDKCVSVMELTDVVGSLGGLDGLLKTK